MSSTPLPIRTFVNLMPGDPAPWFIQRSHNNPAYAFQSAAGRYLVLCFFGSSNDPASRAALEAVTRNRHFDDTRASFFGVSLDPGDIEQRRVNERVPGIRFFFDFDGTVSTLYGAVEKDVPLSRSNLTMRRFWFVIDPTLRIMKVIPFDGEDGGHTNVSTYLDGLPPPQMFAGFELQAPVLVLPNVFEQPLCKQLIDLYEKHGGYDSGVMQEKDGQTVGVLDHRFKRRRDYEVTDPDVILKIQRCIQRRVAPEIHKVHQFMATRMERYLVSCYAVEDRAHFRAHRDNTTKGTAHRRFAVSINLNDDFEGGNLNFPEYGPRQFKPPPGAAVVFSCSLLHQVTQMTRGRRFAFLPFLYDDAAAAVREANRKYFSEENAAAQS